MTYKEILNNLALKNIKKWAHIPDKYLMTGYNQTTKSMPIMITSNAKPYKVDANIAKIETDHDKVADKFTMSGLSNEDFTSNGFYIGSPMDGGR